jgi:hypothetical protein
MESKRLKTEIDVPVALKEERRLRVFENRVLRRIFGLKRDDVTGEWRMKMRWVWRIARMWRKEDGL